MRYTNNGASTLCDSTHGKTLQQCFRSVSLQAFVGLSGAILNPAYHSALLLYYGEICFFDLLMKVVEHNQDRLV
jgi:hypothetical protein